MTMRAWVRARGTDQSRPGVFYAATQRCERERAEKQNSEGACFCHGAISLSR